MEENKMKEDIIKKNENKKTWLDLSAEEINNLSAKSACMYGRKAALL